MNQEHYLPHRTAVRVKMQCAVSQWAFYSYFILSSGGLRSSVTKPYLFHVQFAYPRSECDEHTDPWLRLLVTVCSSFCNGYQPKTPVFPNAVAIFRHILCIYKSNTLKWAKLVSLYSIYRWENRTQRSKVVCLKHSLSLSQALGCLQITSGGARIFQMKLIWLTLNKFIFKWPFNGIVNSWLILRKFPLIHSLVLIGT